MSNTLLASFIEDASSLLGPKLLAIFDERCPGLETEADDSTLLRPLFVVESQRSIHLLRETYRSLIAKNPRSMVPVPRIATPAMLNRRLKLNPGIAEQLTPIVDYGLSSLPEVHKKAEVQATMLATRTFLASVLIAPKRLNAKDKSKALQELNLLARCHDLRLSIELNPNVLIRHLYDKVVTSIRDLNLIGPVKAADAGSSGIVALYEWDSQLIVILSDTSLELLGARIEYAHWEAIFGSVSDRFQKYFIAPVSAFRATIYYELPSLLKLRSLNRLWGSDVVSDLKPPNWRICRDLARSPNDLLTSDFATGYFLAEDSGLPKLIHDYQNILLNIQLRNELLSRVEGRTPTFPPLPLPDKHESPTSRLDAILSHLDWWADYHFQNMLRAQN